jgi:hypothetical protein
VAIREIPERSGISKELTAVATGWLARSGYARIGAAPAPQRGKQIGLNEKGLTPQEKTSQQVRAVENQWKLRWSFIISQLHDILQPMVQDAIRERSPLFG